MLYDVIIIGAGVSGVGAGYKLLQKRPDLQILLLEQGRDHRLGQTGHNSGVLHSPLNYKPGSTKARNCLSGRTELREFCEAHSVPLEICGKVLVATEDNEIPALEKKQQQAVANGITDARLISRDELLEREPNVTLAKKGLLIPGTGILDFAAVAQNLAVCIERDGGTVFYRTQVTGITRDKDHWIVTSTSGEHRGKLIINCGGLQSDRITHMAGLKPKGRIVPVMGIYYKVLGDSKELLKHIVYPLPHPRIPVLGVHAHRTISGEVYAGPNAVVCFSRSDYRYGRVNFADVWDMLSYGGFWKFILQNWKTGIEETLRTTFSARFAREVQKLVPDIRAQDLEPATPGIRAQLVLPNGEAADDFVFTEGPGIICCESVASPGATACLANGTLLADMAIKQLLGT